MSTTRGGETVSAQIGTIGPIEGLSTGNFKERRRNRRRS